MNDNNNSTAKVMVGAPKKSLRNLFGLTKATATSNQAIPKPVSRSGSTMNAPVNWQNKREGETYHNYGIRICGRVTGNSYTLSAFLNKIYNIERQQQISNVQLQNTLKTQIQSEIAGLDKNINTENGNINSLKIRIQGLRDKIENLRTKLTELKKINGEVNKESKLKLIIGCIIISLLTIYLFVFYSSTFYSAFFKDFINIEGGDIGSHMFDPNALPSSFAAGIGQLIFVLSAPVIFLALGFILHYMSKDSGLSKYLKISAFFLITFIFDCILAYSIADKMYQVMTLLSLQELPPYSLSIAFSDHNVWAVIFCGFIVYIIWGFVFDYTMRAYESLRSNQHQQDLINTKIEDYEQQINQADIDISNANTKISNYQNQKNSLLSQLNNNNIIDYTLIKVALNDFYAGWMSVMPTLGCSHELQSNAQTIYDNITDTLFNNNNTNTQTNNS